MARLKNYNLITNSHAHIGEMAKLKNNYITGQKNKAIEKPMRKYTLSLKTKYQGKFCFANVHSSTYIE